MVNTVQIVNHEHSELSGVIEYLYFLYKMAELAREKEYCPTCQHIIAKDMVNLSSLEFRRLIHRITDIEELDNIKGRLYRFIKSSYRVKEYADQFLEHLEDKIDTEDLKEIKLWLLGFINNKDRSYPPRELDLYKFIYSEFSTGIDMPFADFYACYTHWIDTPISKNRVSRALSAFGFKTAMKRVIYDGKAKSTVMIKASEEELAELCQKNGFTTTR